MTLRRSRLGPGAKSRERGSTFKGRAAGLRRHDGRPWIPWTQEQQDAMSRWKEQARATGCVMPGPHEGLLERHHIVPKRALRREGLGELLVDPRNLLPLCELHHTRHERRLQVVPFTLLPQEALEFAREHDFLWYLERYYDEAAAA